MEVAERVRSRPRLNVQWPMLYRGGDFVAEGTMIDVSHHSGRFAGTMPVEVGMRLAIFIDSTQESEDVIIEDAVVTWVSGQDFEASFSRCDWKTFIGSEGT